MSWRRGWLQGSPAADGLRGGPIVDECLGIRISRDVIGHRFALGTNAGPQGIHGTHRAAHRHDPSAATLAAANREGSFRLLNGWVGWGHDGSGSRRPHGQCPNPNRGVSVGVHGCGHSSSRRANSLWQPLERIQEEGDCSHLQHNGAVPLA